MDVNTSVMQMKKFTDTYQEYRNSSKFARELSCLVQQFPAILLDPEPDDQFVGRYLLPAIGFAPQEYGVMGGLGYYINYDKISQIEEDKNLSSANRSVLCDLVDFWKFESTAYKIRNAYPQKLKNAFPSDRWTEDSAVAFPLYRMAGAMLDYKSLLSLGINGLRQKILHYRSKNGADAFYGTCLGSLDLFKDVCYYYIERLEVKVKNQFFLENDTAGKIMDTLAHIAENKPQTLRQAFQLMFLYNTLSGSYNYGRMDDYLGEFLHKDLQTGRITMYEAQKMFESLWRLMIARDTPTDGRIIIGGRGRGNEEAADLFAKMAIETSMRIKDILPQLTLRFYEGQNPELMDLALESIGQGNTFPMLYNDDVNIKAVEEAFKIPRSEAEQYTPFGCGEYVIEAQSFGTPSGIINLLKALEVTLFNGYDIVGQSPLGLKTGAISQFKNFDQFFKAYKKQVSYFIENLAEQEALEYEIAAQETPFLFMSMLYQRCIELGKAIFEGGINYLGGTVETYGNTNASDSLLTIKQLVFEKQLISPDQLLQMLKDNFAGYEKERKSLLSSAKYGNDNDEADEMYQEVHRFVCQTAQAIAQQVGLHSYLVVNINNSSNTILGRKTGASADGRLAYTSMANGNAASPGMDKTGLTSYLKSITKPESGIHAGYVQNIKLSPDLFKSDLDKLKALLRTYFKIGGTQLMINVVNKEDLLRALDHPDEFPNLIVRVGGFSARFIELDRDVQLEIINRTTY